MRVCPYCGAHLDPCEICDCRKEKTAPDEQDPEAALECPNTPNITDL